VGSSHCEPTFVSLSLLIHYQNAALLDIDGGEKKEQLVFTPVRCLVTGLQCGIGNAFLAGIVEDGPECEEPIRIMLSPRFFGEGQQLMKGDYDLL
jgi:hypothetical protein